MRISKVFWVKRVWWWTASFLSPPTTRLLTTLCSSRYTFVRACVRVCERVCVCVWVCVCLAIRLGVSLPVSVSCFSSHILESYNLSYVHINPSKATTGHCMLVAGCAGDTVCFNWNSRRHAVCNARMYVCSIHISKTLHATSEAYHVNWRRHAAAMLKDQKDKDAGKKLNWCSK